MDSIDALVYVVDIHTYEILFLNKYGKDVWGNIEGKVCWERIQSGQKGPCPFCTNDRIVDADGKPTGVYKWEFQNTVNGHWYDCRDSAIRWLDGRLVRLEIASDITERKRIENELIFTNIILSTQQEVAIDGILVVDNSGRIISYNKQFVDLWGITEDVIASKSDERALQLVLEKLDNPQEFQSRVKYLYENKDEKSREEILLADGSVFDRYSSPMKSRDGKYYGRVWFFRDITKLKNAERLLKQFNEELEKKVTARTEELNQSLEEKVLLLREIHHRVNNNVQIMISLLNLQIRSIKDATAQHALQEARNRLKAMSIVYEILYRSKDLSKIDIGEYIISLTKNLYYLYNKDPATISCAMDIPEIRMDISRAIPLGLILNELISNSLRYAFPDGMSGSITISSRTEGSDNIIILRDNGIGLPAGFDWKTTETLGFSLVSSLLDQIDGSMELEQDKGSMFIIRIPQQGE
jgi:PAS domain S-box-containing protein